MLLKNNKNNKGFTLIELLVVAAIIGLLSSVVMASLNSARGKARYAQILEIMHSIEIAAILDYNDYGNYAPDVGFVQNARFMPKYLSAWPTPPCSGYTFDWENWLGGATIKVTLRRADVTPIYYYCIDTTGTCNDWNGTDIKTLASKTLTCSE